MLYIELFGLVLLILLGAVVFLASCFAIVVLVFMIWYYTKYWDKAGYYQVDDHTVVGKVVEGYNCKGAVNDNST